MTKPDDIVDGAWWVVPRELGRQWSEVFRHAWNQPSIRVEAPYPNCGVRALHQFYVRHRRADPAKLAQAPQWLQEKARRYVNGADGLEWCAHCRVYNHIMDKSVPPWWPESVEGIGRGAPEYVMEAVTAHVVAHGDL
ncbi:hypothetical protein [Saccharothrix deserti]|uniref:hypothetical protein n=1 Tax=Saccharothrix deserti TaxID=2593674 RepID=UPI00131AAD2E|nr:hypothetical protein [Saccharothrix deserti]